MYKDSKFIKSQLCCYLKKVGLFLQESVYSEENTASQDVQSALCDLRPSLRNQGILSFTSEILTRLMQYTRGHGFSIFSFYCYLLNS